MKTLARVIATLLIVAAGSAGAYELWDYYMLSPWTRDARVRADVVTIAPDVAGFVNDLCVKDNQLVHKGDILVILDRLATKLGLYRLLWHPPLARLGLFLCLFSVLVLATGP